MSHVPQSFTAPETLFNESQAHQSAIKPAKDGSTQSIGELHVMPTRFVESKMFSHRTLNDKKKYIVDSCKSIHLSSKEPIKPRTSISKMNISGEDPLDVRIRKLLTPTTKEDKNTIKAEKYASTYNNQSCELNFESNEIDLKSESNMHYSIPIEPEPLEREVFGSASSIISNCASRRTLLPTPAIQISDQKDVLSIETLAINRPTLLQTPPKAVKMSIADSLIKRTFNLFLNELRDIMKRDVERRLIEGHAFRTFSSWWDTLDTVRTFFKNLTALKFVNPNWICIMICTYF